MAYANPTSTWAHALLLIPRDRSERLCSTVDMRLGNKFTEKYCFQMPTVEQELYSVAGSKYFANIDLSHSYWQLLLDVNIQERQSFLSSDAVFTRHAFCTGRQIQSPTSSPRWPPLFRRSF